MKTSYFETFKNIISVSSLKNLGMRKLLLTLAAIGLANIVSFAQDAVADNDKQSDEVRTLFGNSNQRQEYGWYGSLSTNYTTVDNKSGVLVGARAAVIVNHNIALGFGGYGIAGVEPVLDSRLGNVDYNYTGGYGGIFIEPIVAAKTPVHVSFPILVGAGGLGYSSDWMHERNDDDNKHYYEDNCAFFVVEPSVELEFNLIKYMRLAFSAGYRLTSPTNLYYKRNDSEVENNTRTRIGSKDMLNGITLGATFKFGCF